MQIRLTVLAPRSGQSTPPVPSGSVGSSTPPAAGEEAGASLPSGARPGSAPAPDGARRACDVLVTAPAGTALAAVASSLAAAVAGQDVGQAVLYAGGERLDAQRCALGEPPLVDGAVLALQSPVENGASGASGEVEAAARLHVVAGPDAGGVHLLHSGRIVIGRAAEADVPLDDPDVSRLHCAVTVADDGRVTVADLGSTNGTTLDGSPVGSAAVRISPGALLRLGESTLRLAPTTAPEALTTTPDGEGHLRVRGQEHAQERPARGRRPVPSWVRDEAAAPGRLRGPGEPLETHEPHEPSAGVGEEVEAGARTGAGAGGPHGDTTHGSGIWTVPAEPGSTPAEPGATAAGEGSRGRDESGARRRGIGAWARRLTGGRGMAGTEGATASGEPVAAAATPLVETWPDPAAVLLTALGPGPRLWERDPGHPEEFVVRLGTVDRADTPSVPVTVGLREAGSLGLAGPRSRLSGLARSVVAQLAALHAPTGLELVLVSADRARSLEERKRDWGWLGWLPHLRPARGQDCRLLVAFDRDQAAARTAELTRRLDEGPLGAGWPSADRRAVDEAAARHTGPRTVLLLDGDPGSAALRETTARLAGAGAAAGIHVICLAETPAASPSSPVAATYEEACAASLAFRECGAVALLSGDVATALRLLRTAGGQPVGHGTVAAVDAVSAAWAQRFARALAPLRAAEGRQGGSADGQSAPPVASPLPRSARLLDELGLARATPASLMARWASASAGTAVLGAGSRGPLAVDLVNDGPHLLIEGPAGSGRTELLRAVAASLAAAGRPDELGLLLVDGAGGERGEGLAACMDLPHVGEHLVASEPVRMRAFAQALGGELKRRAELLDGESFLEWQTRREVSGRLVGQRRPGQTGGGPRGGDDTPGSGAPTGGQTGAAASPAPASSPASSSALSRLVVLVDDYDALVAPALGSPGRPAAGSVVRALEAVARDGERLGVHLVATSARPDRTADTRLARDVRLRVELDAPAVAPGPDDAAPGRGRLTRPDGAVAPFQAGRVTGRIPRTATQRPTVVELEWERMGDPPARRPVRELGNGPTDLALLASALDRAARSVDATRLPRLTSSRA
ncbi:FHA domain-containing protein [Streptomyces sp. NPDC127084]|uniref:FHA domain-containing protein n=1 Tax=Streptomyces sp. NPDC127084 TaxID=3347133 RepID=UPI0036678A4E